MCKVSQNRGCLDAKLKQFNGAIVSSHGYPTASLNACNRPQPDFLHPAVIAASFRNAGRFSLPARRHVQPGAPWRKDAAYRSQLASQAIRGVSTIGWLPASNDCVTTKMMVEQGNCPIRKTEGRKEPLRFLKLIRKCHNWSPFPKIPIRLAQYIQVGTIIFPKKRRYPLNRREQSWTIPWPLRLPPFRVIQPTRMKQVRVFARFPIGDARWPKRKQNKNWATS